MNSRRWWKNSSMLLNVALPTSYYDRAGVPRLAADLNGSNRRMRTRTSGGVGGEQPRSSAAPYPDSVGRSARRRPALP